MTKFQRKEVLIILGPTATGKTDLALKLAKKFNGELMSCDSRQVYVGLDVGTGKLPSRRWKMEDRRWKKGKGSWQIDGVKIWMYDVVSPKIQYSVADYVKDANRVIRDIRSRGKLPIVVGGTGLYLRALIEGLPNLAIPLNKNLRKKLQKLSKEDLQEKLQNLSPERWGSLNESDRENPRRLVRAIELEMGKGNHGNQGIWGDWGLAKKFNILKIGLTASRKVLYERVDERVISRINQGMIEETKVQHKNSLSLKRMQQLGLEYGVLADYLEGKIRDIWGNQGLIKIMQNKIHGFVRRQLTWFKNPSTSSGYINWFDVTDKNYPIKVENLITKWYDSSYAKKN